MENQNDMEMTPERQEAIKNILIMLWEDQYGCKLERLGKVPPAETPV